MHAIRRIAECFILFLPLLAKAASGNPMASERDLYEECSAYSEAGMRDCLATKARESQKALKQAEKQVGVALSKWDEDAKYIKLAQAKLAASGNVFIKYRQEQCEFSASLSGGGAGNAHEMGHLACVAELNSRRAEQLRHAVADLPLK